MDNNFDYLKNKRILLVDDELQLLEMIEGILREAGFTSLYKATNQTEALLLCKKIVPEIAILDVMLPDGDGFTLLKKMREIGDFPVLFLTAKDKPDDLFTGLCLGADDYMAKPFLPRELVLRLFAILRRCYKMDSPVIALKGCRIDFSKAEVERDGNTYPLTAKEVSILMTLFKMANRVITIDAICQSVWGDNLYGYENTLMAHIRRIRSKIEQNPSSPILLVTIKGLGYKLNV